MKRIIQTTVIAAILALLPPSLHAEENKAAYDAVNASLLRGSAHADIIRSLTQGPHDMTLSEATVFAMVSGGDSNRIYCLGRPQIDNKGRGATGRSFPKPPRIHGSIDHELGAPPGAFCSTNP